jgi:YfiH family protein
VHAIRPAIFAPFDRLRCGMSTRLGGVSPEPLGMNLSYRVGDEPARVARNREIFFGALGVPVNALAVPGQVHGAVVRHATAPGEYPECDAIVTSIPGVFCCVSVADCLPVLLFDPRRSVVAAVHAGWRGTAAGIAAEAVRAMRSAHGSAPGDVLAFIGPGASACCYAVGEEVAARFRAEHLRRPAGGEVYADLKAANAAQLADEGVRADRIEIHPSCTISEPTLLHSYRRDGARSGRMMGVIGILPS